MIVLTAPQYMHASDVPHPPSSSVECIQASISPGLCPITSQTFSKPVNYAFIKITIRTEYINFNVIIEENTYLFII